MGIRRRIKNEINIRIMGSINDITRTYDVEFRLHYDNEHKESIVTIGDKEGNKTIM